MKEINGWVPVSILLGIILAGFLVLLGYILIIGRGFYSSLPDYDLPESVSSNAVNIGSAFTASYIEITLDGFLVSSKNSGKNASGDSMSTDNDNEDNDDEDEEEDLDDEYIIPESNCRKLTEEDLEELSPKELSYARNEIYARHGRRFQSNELQDFFNSKEWYEIDDSFEDRDLQGVERSNAEFIAKYQKDNGKMYKVN